MQGIFKWVGDAVGSVYGEVKAVAGATYTAAQLVGAAVFGPGIRERIVDWWQQDDEAEPLQLEAKKQPEKPQGYIHAIGNGIGHWLLHGGRGALNIVMGIPITASLLFKKTKSGWPFLLGTVTALRRLAPVIGYQGFVRPAINSTVKTVTGESVYLSAGAMFAVDTIAYFWFTRNAVNGLIDTTACNMALAKASTVDTFVEKQENQPHNPLMHACGHEPADQVMADIPATYYYLGTRFALYMLASAIPYGNEVTKALMALFLGRTFLEMPLSAAGNCTQDRLEVLNKNNAYAMGVGASYLYLLYQMQQYVEHYTGASGIFVTEALMALLSTEYMLTTMYTRATPLPGTGPGFDVFHHSRVMADSVVGTTAVWAKNQFDQRDNADWYADGKKKFNDAVESKWGQVLLDLVLERDFKEKNRFLSRATIKEFMQTCGPDLRAGIEQVLKMRESRYYRVANYLKDYLPLSEEDHGKLSGLMSDDLEHPLREGLALANDILDPEAQRQREKDVRNNVSALTKYGIYKDKQLRPGRVDWSLPIKKTQ